MQEAEKDKFEVIPMNLEKPSGIELEEFLPKGHSLSSSYSPHQEYSRFSAYKDFGPQTEPSESEVTSTILKGHESMITVLTRRGRNLEIIHKLWQNKDAKAGKCRHALISRCFQVTVVGSVTLSFGRGSWRDR